MSHQCREPGVVPALARQAVALPPAGRARRARRFRRLPGLRHPAALRLVARQADRPRQDARRMPHASQARARRIRGRRDRDDATAVPRARARAGHHRRQLSYPLARALPRHGRDGELTGSDGATLVVITGLVPVISLILTMQRPLSEMAGTSPAMTTESFKPPR